MPDLTSHINFSLKVINDFEGIDRNEFLLGVIAPDCIRTGEFIKESHFLDDNNKIPFTKIISLDSSLEDKLGKDFTLGYITHLYMDYYYDIFSNDLFFNELSSKEEKISAIMAIKAFNLSELDEKIIKDLLDKDFDYKLTKECKVAIETFDLSTADGNNRSNIIKSYKALIEEMRKSFIEDVYSKLSI